MKKERNAKAKAKEVDRDRKHDTSNVSRDKTDDPQRAGRPAEAGEQPQGHGPATPGTSSEPDSPD